MKTKLSPDNPFGPSRYAFAWEHVTAGRDCHLDFGCGDGRFLSSLAGKRLGRLIGIDVSREAIETARRTLPGTALLHRKQLAPLPFADQAIDSITILDVIEHIAEQRLLLDEFHRVLKDDGMLIITVPGQHVFSCLDLGNLKFRFPRLHQWFYCRRHSREQYERRYVSNPNGLVGDVAVEKRWHEHFSRRKLAALLRASGFTVVRFDGTGLFMRVILAMEVTLGRFLPVAGILTRLAHEDDLRFESANLFCLARKREPTVRPSRTSM